VLVSSGPNGTASVNAAKGLNAPGSLGYIPSISDGDTDDASQPSTYIWWWQPTNGDWDTDRAPSRHAVQTYILSGGPLLASRTGGADASAKVTFSPNPQVFEAKADTTTAQDVTTPLPTGPNTHNLGLQTPTPLDIGGGVMKDGRLEVGVSVGAHGEVRVYIVSYSSADGNTNGAGVKTTNVALSP
jgi:hypothetical protein